MNLLLLLSALLSALTGVNVGARRLEAVPAIAQRAITGEAGTRSAMPVSSWRPLHVLPRLRALAMVETPALPIAAPLVPLWAGRRRE